MRELFDCDYEKGILKDLSIMKWFLWNYFRPEYWERGYRKNDKKISKQVF